MKKLSLEKRAIALPLFGLFITWLAYMGSTLADIFTRRGAYDSNSVWVAEQTFRPATHIFFLGIATLAICSLFARRLAIRARNESNDASSLAAAAQRFSTLGITLSLATGVAFALSHLLGMLDRDSTGWWRGLNVYLPILLTGGLVIYVILAAFVFEKTEKIDDVKVKMSPEQKALALGYAIPILFTAIAIVVALVIYDVTGITGFSFWLWGDPPVVWVWVTMIAIIAVGVVLGTSFATKAESVKFAAPKPVNALAAGATKLNFILLVVFGSIVTYTSFHFGYTAANRLREYHYCYEGEAEPGCVEGEFINYSAFFESSIPAALSLLIAIFGIYLSITRRYKAAKVTK